MNITQAIQLANQGKYIRNITWPKEHYAKLSNFTPYNINRELSKGSQWEEYTGKIFKNQRFTMDPKPAIEALKKRNQERQLFEIDFSLQETN